MRSVHVEGPTDVHHPENCHQDEGWVELDRVSSTHYYRASHYLALPTVERTAPGDHECVATVRSCSYLAAALGEGQYRQTLDRDLVGLLFTKCWRWVWLCLGKEISINLLWVLRVLSGAVLFTGDALLWEGSSIVTNCVVGSA